MCHIFNYNMDLKDKDFDFDPDLLNNIFEQLTLEPIPDLSGTLDNLDDEPESNLLGINNGNHAKEDTVENKSQALDLNNSFENDFKKNIKIENDESINLSQEDSKHVSLDEEKVSVALFKEEIEDEGFHYIKSEPLTDSSSSDDENDATLIERGKEEKKRSHKKKDYQRKVSPSPKEFNGHTLRHCSSGFILENHSNFFQVQTSLTSEFFCNAQQVNIPSPKSYYVNSPDSGFGSPSPPNVSSSPPVGDTSLPFDYEDQDEKKKKIQEIYDSILEEVKLYQSEEPRQNSNIHSENCDIEHIFDTEYGIINSLETGITGSPKNGTTSLNYFDQPAELQVPDEDFDDLLNDLVNELLSSQIAQSASETTGSSSENFESVTNQNPVLCYKPVLQEGSSKRKISYNIKDDAKRALRNSEMFDVEKYRIEGRRILQKIKWQEKRREKVKIIEYDERENYQNLQQTNLHTAVIESNIEKVLCIIEALKCYGLDLFDINNQDAYKKTALDYAIEQEMPLLINYLKENTAVRAINI